MCVEGSWASRPKPSAWHLLVPALQQQALEASVSYGCDSFGCAGNLMRSAKASMPRRGGLGLLTT